MINTVMAIDGMIDPLEAQLLMNEAGAPDVRIIVEIGSYRGRSAVALALGSRHDARVYCVDPHAQYTGRGVHTTFEYAPENRAIFLDNIERAGVAQKVHLINKPSIEAAKKWELLIDLLFIDGNHETDPVRADFEAWSFFVRPGGVILLHDNNEPGVQALIESLPSDRYVRVLPDTVLTVKLVKLW